MKKAIRGLVAVITVGSSGIGLATAQRFVSKEGAYVFITGRRQSELDTAVRQIGKNNNNNTVTGVQGDVMADLDRLYATVKEQKGHIDILFANAGIGEFVTLGEISEVQFDKTFGINVKGLLFSVQKALPLFHDGDGGGSIILTASAGRSKGFEGFSVYESTKAAIRSFARSWTVDLKHRKIRVNAISPGPIATPMVSQVVKSEEQAEQFHSSLMSTVPIGRRDSPDEVAKAVSFLV